MNGSDSDSPVALVTGGAKRLGQAIALELARIGYRVCVHYHNSSDEAESTVREIKALGVDAISHSVNLFESCAAAKELIHVTRDRLGPVSLLVNNASLFEPGLLKDSSEELWNRHFNVNLKSPFFLSREFAGQESIPEKAQIINLCDGRVQRPQPGHDVYSLTKSALVTLTRILAAELAPDIRVNAIAPGAVLPPVDDPAGHEQRASESIPLGRPGSSSDIAHAVNYVVNAPFVTGEILNVTGGEYL